MGTTAKSTNSLAFLWNNLVNDPLYYHVRVSFHAQNFYFYRSFSATSPNTTTNSGRDNVECPNQFLKSVSDQCTSGSLRNLGDALCLFDRVLHMHPLPSIVVFNQLLSAIARMRHHSTVISLTKEMELLGIAPDACTLCVLINCFCHLSLVDVGFSILARILKLGFQPHYIILNTLVGGLNLQGKIAEALRFVNKMEKNGYKPNTVTYGIMINCLCHLNRVDVGFSILARILKLGFQPHYIILNTLVGGFCLQGRIAEASRFVNEMVKNGYKPNTITYGTMINGLCKIGETNVAIGLLRKMEEGNLELNVVIYVVIYNTIIDSLCKDKLVIEALNFFSKMTIEGIQPDLFTYKLVIKGLCNFSRWKEAIKLLNEMVQRKVMPDVCTFNILVDTLGK